MITVHQSIYGDRSGSYGLIKTTIADIEHAKRICNVTDVLDRPQHGYLTQPTFRGFNVDGTYVFIKSFPDIGPDVRRGRVLSHVLSVEQRDLGKLHNLDKLLSHFLSQLEKDPDLNPIILDEALLDSTHAIKNLSREAAAINELLNHTDHKNIIIWIGEEGYISFVSKLWGQLNSELRAKLKLGVGFNPPKSDPQSLNVLYVMEEYAIKWKSRGYCIVGKDDSETLRSMASLLLAGHKDKSKPLINLIETYGIVPTNVEDYSYLETVVDTFNNLSTTTDFNQLIVFCDLISKYSQDQFVAKAEKAKLLKQILSRIEFASAKQIITLQNPEWDGFVNAHKLIGEQIANWVAKSFFDYKADGINSAVIASAYDSEQKALWWNRAIITSLQNTLKAWQPGFAIVIWNLLSNDDTLVSLLDRLLPDIDEVEIDLVNHWVNPKQMLAKRLQVFAKDRTWLTLHGICALQLQNPEESIKSQLAIDTNPEHLVSLQRMSEMINNKEFVRIAVQIGETRLVKIASEKAAKNTSLFAKIDVGNVLWRQIWLNSIKAGNRPWDGIAQPILVLFALFEQIINGVVVDSHLMLELGNSNINDLSVFKRRTEVWQYLSGEIKTKFLNATALSCVKLVDKKDLVIGALEKDILMQLSSSTTIHQVINDQTISVTTKVQLFVELPTLIENDLIVLLKSVRFSSTESAIFGKTIYRNHWKVAAKAVADEMPLRSDLISALTECKSLLGVFERIRLSTYCKFSEPISTEEWWSALAEQCYEKYSRGPTQLGLWERCGGKNYDLLNIVTGREIWTDAIRKIRKKKSDVSVQKLIKEMLNDYPSSSELKHLKQILKEAK